MTDQMGAQFEISGDASSGVQAIKQTTSAITQLDAAVRKVNYSYGQTTAQQRQQKASSDMYTRAQNEMAQANLKASKAQAQAGGSLITQRYALYDVARTWTVVSGALLGADLAAAKVAIDFESLFAQVQRTTQVSGSAATDLKKQLVDLTTELPVSFQGIAGIAALGGQLGIASSGITDFTKTVAELTATTNLSSDAAGTALGRFQALLGVPSNQFENLGSSILKVGINSVATESQIVSIATQVSSMGKFAGLTADQVVGLSGALASVGAAPELSRGTITRTFTQMQKAVSDGGAKLQTFAQISGVSADQFKSTWGTPQFADTFQKFLAGVGSQGDNAVAALNAVGISSVRDVPLLMRLGSATGVVSQAFSDAATGFADNTELSKQYGIVAETAAAKLTRLGDTIKAVIEAFSSGADLGPLKALLNFVQGLANAFLLLARNPVGQFFFGLVSVIGLAVGALAAFRAMQALTLASLYAMKTASDALTESAARQGGEFKVLSSMTTMLFKGYTGLAAAQKGAATSTEALNGAMATGTTGARGLSVALKGIGASLGWTALLLGATTLLSNWANQQAQTKQDISDLESTLDGQTRAITDNSRAWVVNKFSQDGTLQKANSLGIDVKTLTDAALGNTSALASLRVGYNALGTEIDNLNPAYLAATAAAGTYGTGQEQEQKQGESTIRTYMMLEDQHASYGQVLAAAGIVTTDLGKSQEDARLKAQAMGSAVKKAADDQATLTSKMQDTIDTFTGGADATAKVQDAIFSLGSSLAQNGSSFDVYSAKGRANFQSLQGVIAAMVSASAGDSQSLATMLGGLMSQLSGYGVDAVNQLGFVMSMITSLSGGSALPGLTSQANIAGLALKQGFSSGVDKASKSSKGAAKEVKTLTDYISDLSSVVKGAFDIRFGYDQSVDKAVTSYQSLADSFTKAQKDANDLTQQLNDLYASQQKLTADRTVLTYQLGVAKEYGDTLRTNEITASLAQNSADLTKNQSDLTSTTGDLKTAQDKLTPNLEGNTAASIDQRSAVLDLVQAYEDQITTYANTGASADQVKAKADQLRQTFANQMSQLGYNRDAIAKYAKSFDDVTRAIAAVPKNINVSASTDPAQRAIDEFIAKNANKNVSIDATIDSGTADPNLISMLADYFRTQFEQQMAKTPIAIDGYLLQGQQVYRVPGTEMRLYASGGFTGAGGKYDAAGIVHKGEYVIPQSMVNQTTGLPYANALGNIIASTPQTNNYYSGGYVSGPAVQLVELMPHQVQQIVSALSVNIGIDGSSIAHAANGTNAANARRGSN